VFGEDLLYLCRLRYPSIFLGNWMIFSPSLWIRPKIYFDAIAFYQLYPLPISIYMPVVAEV